MRKFYQKITWFLKTIHTAMVYAKQSIEREIQAKAFHEIFFKILKESFLKSQTDFHYNGNKEYIKMLCSYFEDESNLKNNNGTISFNIGRFYFEIEYQVTKNETNSIILYKTFEIIKDSDRVKDPNKPKTLIPELTLYVDSERSKHTGNDSNIIGIGNGRKEYFSNFEN